MTKEERNAVRSLQRLAKRWPDTLWLFSASGSLCVLKMDENGERVKTTNQAVDQAHVVATIDIPNDGGDW